MSTNTRTITALAPGLSSKLMWLSTIGWLVAVILGFVWLYGYTLNEQTRDVQSWQRQLQLTVASQSRQVEQWLGAQQSVVTGLAGNTSLKLYLTELDGKPATSSDGQAFTAFLRNLLISEAVQHGFHKTDASGSIPANVPISSGAGIAILDKRYRPIVSTAGMPELGSLPKAVTRELTANKKPKGNPNGKSPIGPFLIGGIPHLLWASAISSIQSTTNTQGYIVAVKPVAAELAELLALPPQAAPTSESFLVRKQGENITYITKLADGTAPLSLKLAASTPRLLSAYAADAPGTFLQQEDYLGNTVIATSQLVPGTDWLLIHKVDRAVAFAAVDERRKSLLSGYTLLAGLITMSLIAIWRSISATRARESANHFEQLSVASEKQQSLLSHLTNTLIMLVDSRDPHAQHHSNGVALVAGGIAGQMELSEPIINTTALAASLMNVGKIKTPEALFSEKDLTPENKDQIRKSILESADLLKDIEFDGPVVSTLRQAMEHVDGSGPLGLQEDDIILPARIIAVANAFVAMVSTRAYREAMSIDTALDELHKLVDKTYSRKVVAALEHYIENAGGRENWGQIAAAAKAS